jgi:hypothetical protein
VSGRSILLSVLLIFSVADCLPAATYFVATNGNDTHSLFADPLFVNAANFHLATNSPAVNVSDPAFAPAAGETDIDGQPPHERRRARRRFDLASRRLCVSVPPE